MIGTRERTCGVVFNTKPPMSAAEKEGAGVNPARAILLMLLPRQLGSKGLILLPALPSLRHVQIHTYTYRDTDIFCTHSYIFKVETFIIFTNIPPQKI